MSYILRKYQEAAVSAGRRALAAGCNGILVLPTGCHAKGTAILMYDGSVQPVESIAVGQRIMGPDSRPRRVLALCRGRGMMYRVHPLRGADPFVVNEEHVLSLVCTSEGKACPCRAKGGEVDHVSVRDYLAKSKSWRHLRKLRWAGPIQFSEMETPWPIPPWILGVILGDGCTLHGGVCVTTPDQEIMDGIEAYAQANGLAVRRKNKRYNQAVDLCLVKRKHRHNRTIPNPLMVALRTLGVAGQSSPQKRIPVSYKTATVPARLELLAGLLDTDGSLGNGCYDFVTQSKGLADDMVFVSRSLGFRAHLRSCVKRCQTGVEGLYYRICLSGDTERIPCRVVRKRACPRRQKKNWLRTGFRVEALKEGDFYGFTLDADHLYLTEDFVIHHNSGKSLVIASVLQGAPGKSLVLQPTKEILEQNHAKAVAFGFRDIGVWSASCGRKDLGKVTFAMIGSMMRHQDAFRDFDRIIVDEVHRVDSKQGQYQQLIRALGRPTIGCTATPYRMRSYVDARSGEQVAESHILTRTRPRIFDSILHVTQIRELVDAGFWCPLVTERDEDYDSREIPSNSTGQDFDEDALRRYQEAKRVVRKIADAVRRISARHVLVFTRFREESTQVLDLLGDAGVSAAEVSAETPKRERERIVRAFRSGEIRSVVNVGVFTVGFDYPELDAVVLGRPTKSVALFYQMCGRGVRPAPGKDGCRLIDFCGNIKRFGAVESFELVDPSRRGLWQLRSAAGLLTGVNLNPDGACTGTGRLRLPAVDPTAQIPFGKHKGETLASLPMGYLRWGAEKLKGQWQQNFQAEMQRRQHVAGR